LTPCTAPGALAEAHATSILTKSLTIAKGLKSPFELPKLEMLAISGGGENGAFGAGLLCGWTDQGARPEFEVVTGISTGALTAPFSFLGPNYDAHRQRQNAPSNPPARSQENRIINGVFTQPGSFPDVGAHSVDVRFALGSGHSPVVGERRLCAKSGRGTLFVKQVASLSRAVSRGIGLKWLIPAAILET
jgi:patatin-like phospholipase